MKKLDFVIKEYEDGTLKIECINIAFHFREEAFLIDNIKKEKLFDLMRSISILTIEKYDMIASFTILFFK